MRAKRVGITFEVQLLTDLNENVGQANLFRMPHKLRYSGNFKIGMQFLLALPRRPLWLVFSDGRNKSGTK